MSWENLKDAYRTRLGNLTAKSVLVLIVDEANAEGLAFVGLERVSTLTEINKRTTLRIIQVFGEIDLVNRAEAHLKGKLLPAFQVNLAMLGLDLRDEFARAHGAAQGKCGKRLRDTGAGVSATRSGVSETLPPHPLIGGPLLFPLESPTPIAPASGGGDALKLAVDQVCSALAVSNRRKRKLLRDVIALEAEKGDAPAAIALAMIAAWNAQAVNSPVLRVMFGLSRFFSEGLWKDSRRWHWDQERLRSNGRASVGS